MIFPYNWVVVVVQAIKPTESVAKLLTYIFGLETVRDVVYLDPKQSCGKDHRIWGLTGR